jgi:hypothetical protein
MLVHGRFPKKLSQALFAIVLLTTHAAIAQGPTSIIAETGSLSPNTGQYANVISRFEPSTAYTEVCFKGGAMMADLHSTGETANGGNCAPGDLGWIIEKYEREADCWYEAKATCLKEGMRLPEPFEYQVSCDNATTFGLSAMTSNYEWASNTAFPIADSGGRGTGLGAMILGNLGCGNGTWEWVARSDANQCDTRPFRCVR